MTFRWETESIAHFRENQNSHQGKTARQPIEDPWRWTAVVCGIRDAGAVHRRRNGWAAVMRAVTVRAMVVDTRHQPAETHSRGTGVRLSPNERRQHEPFTEEWLTAQPAGQNRRRGSPHDFSSAHLHGRKRCAIDRKGPGRGNDSRQSAVGL